MDKELFKKLENSEIWEFRTLFNGICYRLFAFWDTEIEALIVATHGMVKKTQKTPKSEIEKAEKLRKEYFNDKIVMAKMNLTPLSVVVDDVWGEKGTPERDAMETQLKEDLQAYYIGEAIKAERLRQNLTQEELGAKVGVKKSQISKLESGKCIITLPTMSKIFKALGFRSASLDLEIGGKVALW